MTLRENLTAEQRWACVLIDVRDERRPLSFQRRARSTANPGGLPVIHEFTADARGNRIANQALRGGEAGPPRRPHHAGRTRLQAVAS